MLLPRRAFVLVLEQREASRDPLARTLRLDDLVDEAALGRAEGVEELAFVVGRGVRDEVCVVEALAVQHLDRALGAHHGDLGGGPGIVEVRAEVLGRHHAVGAAIGLARDHGDHGHRRLAVGIEQLRAVLDDAVILLCRPGEEARHVHQRQDRDAERVAEADEARGLARGGRV